MEDKNNPFPTEEMKKRKAELEASGVIDNNFKTEFSKRAIFCGVDDAVLEIPKHKYDTIKNAWS